MTVNFEMNGSPVATLIALVVAIIMLVATWRVFEKADEHGWAIFVPFYGQFCQFRMTFGSGWMFLLMFLPIVNFVIAVMLYFKLAKVFGKGVGFGFGLMFLPFIFLPILGFGDAEYLGV